MTNKKPFKYRGPNMFYFKRKRYPLDNLKVNMASKRTCSPGGGGFFDGVTGDGEAWCKGSDHLRKGWSRKRIIKAGQWVGWYIRTRIEDL